MKKKKNNALNELKFINNMEYFIENQFKPINFYLFYGILFLSSLYFLFSTSHSWLIISPLILIQFINFYSCHLNINSLQKAKELKLEKQLNELLNKYHIKKINFNFLAMNLFNERRKIRKLKNKIQNISKIKKNKNFTFNNVDDEILNIKKAISILNKYNKFDIFSFCIGIFLILICFVFHLLNVFFSDMYSDASEPIFIIVLSCLILFLDTIDFYNLNLKIKNTSEEKIKQIEKEMNKVSEQYLKETFSFESMKSPIYTELMIKRLKEIKENLEFIKNEPDSDVFDKSQKENIKKLEQIFLK